MAGQLRHLIEVEKVPKPYTLHPTPYTFSEHSWCLAHSKLPFLDKDCMRQSSQLSLSKKESVLLRQDNQAKMAALEERATEAEKVPQP